MSGTDMQQLLLDIRNLTDDQFVGVSADALRRADVQLHDDGTLVVSLRVLIDPDDATYYIDLLCEPWTRPAMWRAWQHLARPAQARAIHGRALELIRQWLGAPSNTVDNDIALLPAYHAWHDSALPGGYLCREDRILCDTLRTSYAVWGRQFPDASEMLAEVVYDNMMSLAVEPLTRHLLVVPHSDPARAIAACQRARAEYLALLAREDALERALRVRGVPAVDATHWIAPRDDDLDTTLATLLP